MKVSEITINDINVYLKLEDLTPQETTELSTLLSIAKKFIKSYTGLEDLEIKGEKLGIGDGVNKTFNLANKFVSSETVYIDGIVKTVTTDYTIDYEAGTIEFNVAPTLNSVITANYKSLPSDKHEDFVIVVYVLIQDMYENRTLYVDKNNLNKVVDTILGMHCTNLL